MAYLNHRYYINIRMLLRVIGWLLCIEAGFMIFPLLCGLIYSEHSAISFLICTAVTGGVGVAMTCIKLKSREMGKREAILLTSLIWIILSLFGMLPFHFTGTHMNITDAFFETMSGFTTTGASVLNTLEGVPHSILLWRCIVQWVGGLGIILFTLAVVPMLNYQGGMQLFNAEVTGITHDKLRPRVSFTAKSLWMVYIVLTSILIILLSFSEMNFFDALCYGLSTMSTGGFATSDMAIHTWDSIYMKSVLCIFMFIGGVNFSLLYNVSRGNVKNLWKNSALKTYIALVLCGYVLLTINVFIQGLVTETADATIDPLFQTISLISSTGITEPDFNDWGPLATVVMTLLMFMGACAGSTSGGAKIDRFIILFKFLKNEFYKIMHPSVVTTVTVNGKGTPNAVVQKTLAFLFVYIIVVVVGGVILGLSGMSLHDALFCSLSAISNTGLATDTTGISGNYSFMSPAAKWVLSFIMLIGRLELFTVLLIFTPTFWKK